MILHLDMPKSFTLAVREFNYRTCSRLASKKISYRQIDTNPLFWRFIFKEHNPEFLSFVEDVFSNKERGVCTYQNIIQGVRTLNHICSFQDLVFDLKGVVPKDKAVSLSASAINSFIESSQGAKLFHDFSILLNKKFDFSQYKIISIGADSESSLVYGIAVARYVKENFPAVHVCLGRHHYENFSLLHTLDKIIKEKAFFTWVDSMVLYEELQGYSFLSLLNYLAEKDTESVENLALKEGGEINIYYSDKANDHGDQLEVSSVFDHTSLFLADLDCAPESIHYNMNLVDNQCYYSKCVFCVQINKHLSKRFYQEKISIQRAFEVIRYLHAKGVKYFSFTDEALRPTDLDYLADLILRAGLEIRWNMRLIADVKFKPELAEKVYKAGCREVLFGLETINPGTSSNMGKVSSKNQLDQLYEMIFSFTRNKINIILSMIYGFPAAPENEDEEYTTFSKKLLAHNDRIFFIFNQFSLFGGTEIYKNYLKYGIKHVMDNPSEQDLNNIYSYEDDIGRGEPDPKRALRYACIRLGVSLQELVKVAEHDLYQILESYYFLEYSSFGFTFGQKKGYNLYKSLKNAKLLSE